EMLFHMAAEKDDDGNVSAVTGVIRDVTEEAKADRALRDSLGLVKDKSASLEEAQRLARSGSWRRPLDVDKLEMDGRCYELLKFDPGTLNTRRSDMQVHYLEDDFSRVVELQQKTEETGEEQQIDVRMRRGDGVVIDMRIRMKLERDVDGKATALFGTMQDVSTEKSAERELQQLAFYDNLTGLANRTLFKRELARCCEEASEGIGEAALLLLDLDNFKEVNDTLGHLAGDHLLEVVGRRLKAIVPTADFVSRLGGDEFAVIVRSNLQRSEIEDLCEKIDHSISLPADLGVGEVETSVSIGIAATPEHSIEPDELMRFADLALYKAKENGKGRRSHFAPELSSAMTARLSLANEIRSALAEDRFEVHYQPIIGAADGMVEGFEALLRLPRADGTYIPPGQFVPIAESSHLIAELGSFVLHRACREAQSWIDAGIRPRRVSVNVSAAQLWHGDVEKVIDSALSSSGLDPENLCIELTETVFAADFLDRLEGILKRLSDNGVCLALDDFGTGYSSLSYLNRLPFDRLKIDRAFITDAQLCEERIKLLRGIVELGKGLNMSVVAEGVETADELSLVTDADCDLLQGWYFGRAERSDVAIREAASIEAKATANRLAEKRPVHPVGDAVLAAMLSGHRA
ncbi:MAG: EAL domain-containing protein, partial [Pseudomonadota bacterium]